MCSCDSSLKSRMWETIHYLNDPHLVLKFQNYFGIHRVSNQNGSNGIIHNGDISSTPSKESEVIKRKSVKTVADDDLTGVSSESDNDNNEYIVKNKIWYYLFYLGTILGDEIFYASFIPFWFWNIDGAVGRRVVNVWALIMYIGKPNLKLFKSILHGCSELRLPLTTHDDVVRFSHFPDARQAQRMTELHLNLLKYMEFTQFTV